MTAKLLVVDDNEANRDLLSRRLRKLGHEVRTADGGAQALAMMRESETDLLLLDVMMPEMSGYEVLETVVRDPVLCHVPVIMVSALDEVSSVVRCIELGAEDYLPKPFDPVILRARVGASLEKKRLRDRERAYAKSMERDLEIGRAIQASFFPESLPDVDGWQIAAAFESARQVAGDFYDAFCVGDAGTEHVVLIVGDVCDKGVGAALFMALFRSLLRSHAERELTGCSVGNAGSAAERILGATNDYIARTHGRANMFATVFLGVLDPATGTLQYVNAGHEPPRLVTSAGCVRLDPTGPAAGMLEGIPFGSRDVALAPGDALLVVTDGVTEARGADGDLFGDDRLDAELVTRHESAAALLAAVRDAVHHRGVGVDLADDLTMLALRRA